MTDDQQATLADDISNSLRDHAVGREYNDTVQLSQLRPHSSAHDADLSHPADPLVQASEGNTSGTQVTVHNYVPPSTITELSDHQHFMKNSMNNFKSNNFHMFENLTLEDSLGSAGGPGGDLSVAINSALPLPTQIMQNGQALQKKGGKGEEFKIQESKAEEISTESENDTTKERRENSHERVRNTKGNQKEDLQLQSDHSQNSKVTKSTLTTNKMSALQCINQQSYSNISNMQAQKSEAGGNSMQTISDCRQEAQYISLMPPNKPKQDTDEQVDETDFQKEEDPVDNKVYELFGWGLNDNHQLGQLGGAYAGGTQSSHAFDSNRLHEVILSPSTGSFPSGCSTSKAILIPRLVRDFENVKVKHIGCGSSHSMILTTSGAIYALGNNSHGQLGLSVQKHPLISFPQQITIQNANGIKDIQCSSSHTLLLNAYGQILGAGLNENGQVGHGKGQRIIVEDFQQIYLPIAGSVEKIFCNDGISGALIRQNNCKQEIVIWGRFEEQDQAGECGPRRIPIPSEIFHIKDAKLSLNSLAVLTSTGHVYQYQSQSGEFFRIQILKNIVEIASHQERFGALDTSNEIYLWKSANLDSMKCLDSEADKFASKCDVKLKNLSIGEDFGHAIDQYGNLHGWGNNKNGELGTGDSYPRYKLSQIRVFDNHKSYLRCRKVFHGHNFSFGLFESVKCTTIQSHEEAEPLPVRPNVRHISDLSPNIELNKTQTLSASKPLSSSKGQLDIQLVSSSRFAGARSSSSNLRHAKYQATEKALEHYRKHSKIYRENAAKLQSHALQYGKSQTAKSNENVVESSRRNQSSHQAARSISPYQQNFQKTLSTLLTDAQKTCQYSPDIMVTRANATNVAGHKVSSSQTIPSNFPVGTRQLEDMLIGQATIQTENNKRHQEDVRLREAQAVDALPNAYLMKPDMVNSIDMDKETQPAHEKQLSASVNAYSFSQLQHKFDEHKEELQHLRKQSNPQTTISFDVRDNRFCQQDPFSPKTRSESLNLSSNFAKRRRDWSVGVAYAAPLNKEDQMVNPPTVTSIDVQDGMPASKQIQDQMQIQSVEQRKARDQSLDNRIVKSISAASSILNLSKLNSRSQSVERPIRQSSSRYNFPQQQQMSKERQNAYLRDSKGLQQTGWESQENREQFGAHQFKREVNDVSKNTQAFLDQLAVHNQRQGSRNRHYERPLGPTPGDSTMTLLKSTERPSAYIDTKKSSEQPIGINTKANDYIPRKVSDPKYPMKNNFAANPYDVSGQSRNTQDQRRSQSNSQMSAAYNLHDVSLTKTSAEQSFQLGQVAGGKDKCCDKNYVAQIQKLNKYKRKLKKYMATNKSLQHQVGRLNDLNAHLSSQNDRLMRYGKQSNGIGEALQQQLQTLEEQMAQMRGDYESKLNEKNDNIDVLTDENLKIINDIQDRDIKHKQLEEKLEYVDQEIEKLGAQLKEQNSINSKLKGELDRYKAKSDRRAAGDQTKREEIKSLKNQLRDVKKDYQARGDELIQKDQQIIDSQRNYGRSQKQVKDLNRQLREMQKILSNLQMQNIDNNKTLEGKNTAISYQDLNNGILSGKESKTTDISQRSVTNKNRGNAGPILMNFQNMDNSNTQQSNLTVQQQDKYIKHNNNQQASAKNTIEQVPNVLSFQPSRDKLEQILQDDGEEGQVQTDSLEVTMSHQQNSLNQVPAQQRHNVANQLGTFQKRNRQDGLPTRDSMNHEQILANRSRQQISADYQGEQSTITQPTIQVQYQYAADMVSNSASYPLGGDEVMRAEGTNQISCTSAQFRRPADESTDRGRGGMNISNLNQSSIYGGAQDDNSFTNFGGPSPYRGGQRDRGNHSKYEGRSLSEPPDLRDQRYLQHFHHPGRYLPTYAQPPVRSPAYLRDAASPGEDYQRTGASDPNQAFPNYAYIQSMYYNIQRQEEDRALQKQKDEQFKPSALQEKYAKYYNMDEMLASDTIQNPAKSPASDNKNQIGPTVQSIPKAQADSKDQVKLSAEKITSSKYSPKQIHISNFNSRIPESRVNEMVISGMNSHESPELDKKKNIINFSEISADEQQRLIDMMKDKSRTQSRERIYSRDERSSQFAQPRVTRNHHPNKQPPHPMTQQAGTYSLSYNLRDDKTLTGNLSLPDTLQEPDYPYDRRQEHLVQQTIVSPEAMLQRRDLDSRGFAPESEVTPVSSQRPPLRSPADSDHKPKPNYKDAILSKFSKRTNNRMLQEMKSRDKSAPIQRPRANDSEEKQQPSRPDLRTFDRQVRDYSADQYKDGEPRKDARSGKAASLADEGRSDISNQRRSDASQRRRLNHDTTESLSQIVENYGGLDEVRRSFGNLRSNDRFQEIKEKKDAQRDEVQQFRDRSKEWYLRKGRNEPDVSHQDVSKKYKDAFRDLSMEVKRRISEAKKDTLPHNYSSSAYNYGYGNTRESNVERARGSSAGGLHDFDSNYMSHKYLVASMDPSGFTTQTIQVNKQETQLARDFDSLRQQTVDSASDSKYLRNSRTGRDGAFRDVFNRTERTDRADVPRQIAH